MILSKNNWVDFNTHTHRGTSHALVSCYVSWGTSQRPPGAASHCMCAAVLWESQCTCGHKQGAMALSSDLFRFMTQCTDLQRRRLPSAFPSFIGQHQLVRFTCCLSCDILTGLLDLSLSLLILGCVCAEGWSQETWCIWNIEDSYCCQNVIAIVFISTVKCVNCLLHHCFLESDGQLLYNYNPKPQLCQQQKWDWLPWEAWIQAVYTDKSTVVGFFLITLWTLGDFFIYVIYHIMFIIHSAAL